MSTLWIRELRSTSAPGNTGLWVFLKGVALFLQRCCGWTNPVESIGGGGGSFFSYSSTGTHGELNPTGTDKNLVDSTYGSFSGSDVGRFIVVCDAARPINAGVYKITANPNANTVTLDFRSGAAEYPTHVTGLTWYIYDPVAGTPSTGYDYFRLTSPSVYGWAVQFTGWNGFIYGTDGLLMRVSLSGNFGVGPLLPADNDLFFSHSGAGGNIYWYLCVDSEGKWVIPMSYDGVNNYYGACFASELEQIYDDGYPKYAKFGVLGSIYQIYVFNPMHRGFYTGSEYLSQSCGEGQTRWPQLNYTVRTILTEHSYAAAANGLTTQTSPIRALNSRTGKWDVFKPGPLVADTGGVGGLMSMYRYYNILGRPMGWYDCAPAVGVRTAFDCDGTKDKFHMVYGWCFDWPGVTPSVELARSAGDTATVTDSRSVVKS